MHIVEARVDTLEIAFREPVRSGNQDWGARRLAVIRLATDSGHEGLGEVSTEAPMALAEPVSPDALAPLLGLDVWAASTDVTVSTWDGSGTGRALRSGMASALEDLRARSEGRSLAARLSDARHERIDVNAMLGIGEPTFVAERAAELVGQGFRCIKLKGGAEATSDLVDRVAAVREAVGPDVGLRIDFNGALDMGAAVAAGRALRSLGLEYMEQPLDASRGPEALARLRREQPVPVAADESLTDLEACRRIIALEAADVIVVKAARVGGLREAHTIAMLGAEAGLGVVVNTLFGTGIAIAGAAQLAAALPGREAHGLATAGYLATDLLREPLRIVDGGMTLPSGPGLGIALDEAAVARVRVA